LRQNPQILDSEILLEIKLDALANQEGGSQEFKVFATMSTEFMSLDLPPNPDSPPISFKSTLTQPPQLELGSVITQAIEVKNVSG
jgi:hypothetical protein